MSVFDNMLSQYKVKLTLAKRIKSVDINAVKNDVMPFLKNPKDTEIWSENYFLELARLI